MCVRACLQNLFKNMFCSKKRGEGRVLKTKYAIEKVADQIKMIADPTAASATSSFYGKAIYVDNKPLSILKGVKKYAWPYSFFRCWCCCWLVRVAPFFPLPPFFFSPSLVC